VTAGYLLRGMGSSSWHTRLVLAAPKLDAIAASVL
jgi:hypothetical protein